MVLLNIIREVGSDHGIGATGSEYQVHFKVISVTQ